MNTFSASMAALAALGLVAVNYQTTPQGSQLFLSERISEQEKQFMDYVVRYGKNYATAAEFKFRAGLFMKTLDKIEAHNTNQRKTSTVGVNAFSDFTEEEYKKLLGYKKDIERGNTGNIYTFETDNLADSIDWRENGAVSPVKDQGQCGSCWAFSTTGAIEGAYQISTGYLNYFSEQNLVDCDNKCMGCNGGLMIYGFQYAEKSPLQLEADYPYTATTSECVYDATKGYGKVTSYIRVPSGDASQLKAALMKGPVSVAIEADDFVFQHYTSGIITSDCGDQLDHGVLAVGYGTENGQDYFLVKNSWSASWGDAGYVKIAPDQCGITKDPAQPYYN